MVWIGTGLTTAATWIVNGDPPAQALICVALLIVVRDVLALRFRLGRDSEPAVFPPVSILKPVHGDEPLAEQAFRSYCLLDYPVLYQVIFAFEDDCQPLLPLARSLAVEFPDRVRCLLSGPPLDASVNGKSHNLAAAGAAARYDLLLISDSDTIADPGTLRRLVAPLADGRVGAVAATPRVVMAAGVPGRLERLLVNGVLAPFEYAAAQARGPHGLWGTLLLVRRGCIEAAGGFLSLGRYLAEDVALEESLRRQGFRGALVRRPVDVICAELDLRQLLRHWHRWLVGLRRMRPATYACMGLILLAYLLPVVVFASLWLLPGAFTERIIALCIFAGAVAISLFATGRAGIGVREPLSSYLLLPLALAALLAAFCWSLVDNSVIWRGRRLAIGRYGRIDSQPSEVGNRAGAP